MSDESGNPSPRPAAAAAGAGAAAAWPRRRCRDVFWLLVFLLHLLVFGGALALFGLNRFGQADRFKIDRFTNLTAAPGFAGSPEPAPPPPVVEVAEDVTPPSELTETYWPYYGAAGALGAALAWAWLAAAAGRRDGGRLLMRAAVHSLTAYLAVVSVLCFWGKHFFWGVAFAVGAALHFLYVMSVLDRYSSSQLHFLNWSVIFGNSIQFGVNLDCSGCGCDGETDKRREILTITCKIEELCQRL